MISKFWFFVFLFLPLNNIIQGQASVIDGDTIEIRGQRIRLHGIDAPESSQTCIEDGNTWRCGQQVALKLSDFIGKQNVRCAQKDTDRYGRLVCECFVGSTNINEWLVENGWALAYRQYSTDYVDEEAKAKAAKVGIWNSEFVNPADYRKGDRLSPTPSASETASTDCQIKGNINRDGVKIYHVPGGKYYSQTKISPEKGERWFSSEAEAKAAGWRASKE